MADNTSPSRHPEVVVSPTLIRQRTNPYTCTRCRKIGLPTEELSDEEQITHSHFRNDIGGRGHRRASGADSGLAAGAESSAATTCRPTWRSGDGKWNRRFSDT